MRAAVYDSSACQWNFTEDHSIILRASKGDVFFVRDAEELALAINDASVVDKNLARGHYVPDPHLYAGKITHVSIPYSLRDRKTLRYTGCDINELFELAKKYKKQNIYFNTHHYPSSSEANKKNSIYTRDLILTTESLYNKGYVRPYGGNEIRYDPNAANRLKHASKYDSATRKRNGTPRMELMRTLSHCVSDTLRPYLNGFLRYVYVPGQGRYPTAYFTAVWYEHIKELRLLGKLRENKAWRSGIRSIADYLQNPNYVLKKGNLSRNFVKMIIAEGRAYRYKAILELPDLMSDLDLGKFTELQLQPPANHNNVPTNRDVP